MGDQMLGAIIGDIAGSTYEVDEIIKAKKKEKVSYEDRIKILNLNIPLFKENSSYTDDTVLTTAIADCILNNGSYEEYLKKYALNEINLGKDIYGRSRFSKGFCEWVLDNKEGNSFGNGCSMRISPVPNYFYSYSDILEETKKSTIPSHNHEESLIATKAVSLAIFLAKQKIEKQDIKRIIEKECNYDLNFDLEQLQKNYKFSSKASNSVPQAIYCFLVSTDFEDAIRKSISIGGDCDTVAAITGSIAEVYYGIPKEIISEANKFIPDYVKEVINKFYFALEFRDFLKENGMNNKLFLEYCNKFSLIVPSGTEKSWYGCFPLVNSSNFLTGFKLLVPELKTKEDLDINIHEYTHAFELFSEIGTQYTENREQREESAINNEKKYKIKRKW